MAFQYPEKPWFDGQIVRRELGDGTVMIGVYNASKNLWSFAKTSSDGDSGGPDGSIVTTANVFTLNERPTLVRSPFAGGNIITQQEANWFLQDQVEQVIFVGDSPPPLVDGEQVFTFWFDSDTLELLIYHNEQWFPVSIPPTQINVLKEVVEGLEVSVTQVRGDIAKNKVDIDENMLDLTERIDAVEATANSAISSVSNAAIVNKDNSFASNRINTFNGQVKLNGLASIGALSNTSTSPNFEIRGTSYTGTVNSRVFYAMNTNGRLQIIYNGVMESNSAIVTKGYVAGAFISRVDHEAAIAALTTRIIALEGGTNGNT